MKVFVTGTPLCRECFTIFEGTIQEDKNRIMWVHLNNDKSPCVNDNGFFIQDLDKVTFTVIGLIETRGNS